MYDKIVMCMVGNTPVHSPLKHWIGLVFGKWFKRVDFIHEKFHLWSEPAAVREGGFDLYIKVNVVAARLTQVTAVKLTNLLTD